MLVANSWQVGPVTVASTFLERLVGMRSKRSSALLLHTRSVHGSGLTDPLLVLHLTRSGELTGHNVLSVGAVVRARAFWVLELPLDTPLPPMGARLRVLPSSPG